MKKGFLAGVGLFFISTLIFGVTKFTNQASELSTAQVQVLIKEDTFKPENLEIKKGTTVVFKNETADSRWPASNLHPTHGIFPEFDPKNPVKPGESWEFRFNKVGSWKYHDHLVPIIKGLIIVK